MPVIPVTCMTYVTRVTGVTFYRSNMWDTCDICVTCAFVYTGKKRVDVDTLDHSYQLSLDSELVPQPLVAAAWEQSNYDVIDQLLLLDADVCNSYSNQPEINPAKPLFYQVSLRVGVEYELQVVKVPCLNLDIRCIVCTVWCGPGALCFCCI